jgi:hypothetical protein
VSSDDPTVLFSTPANTIKSAAVSLNVKCKKCFIHIQVSSKKNKEGNANINVANEYLGSGKKLQYLGMMERKQVCI